MAILTFVIGAILFAAGAASLAMSVDLVPTEMGRLYAECGVILIGASGVVVAVGALIARLNGIFATPRPARRGAAEPQASEPAAPAGESAMAAAAAEDEINFNRRGHLPTLREVEEAIAEPEARPEIVGRYSSGGVKYAIYSDGAIEAETEQGDLRFSSMEELKAFVATRKT